MRRWGPWLVGVMCLCVWMVPAHADVKTEQKGQVQFSGALGRVVNMFGGKAARDGVVTRMAVKGDRMMTAGGDKGQLVDLAEEKVYDIDFGGRSYKVTTFEELRRRMREAQEKARRSEAKRGGERAGSGEQAPEYEIDMSSKPTGATRTINGFDTRQVITTVTVRQTGKTLEQGGGMVLTADNWVGPRIAALREIADFHVRYMKTLDAPFLGGGSADQMAAAMAMYPMLEEALAKMKTEGENVEGASIASTTTIEMVQSAEQVAQARQEEDAGAGAAGGLGGMLARRMKKKKDDGASGETPGRATLMTMTGETLSVSTEVTDADVAVPAGFKEKK